MKWKKSWKSSEKPEKQRKYRRNAPEHHQKQFLSARLGDDVREKVGTKTLPVREGDRAEIMRGDHRGETGEVTNVDHEEYKIYLDGVERERVDTTAAKVAIRPSNLKITKLNTDDHRRLRKYNVTEEDKEDISVEEEEEEEEEAEETENQELEERDIEEELDESSDEVNSEEGGEKDEDTDADYEELANHNISDIKDAVKEEDIDSEKMLEVEKQNKDRKTLKEWLKKQSNGGEN